MNRNPKPQPPSEALKKATAAMFPKFDRSKARDCSVCRNSMVRGTGFVCKLNLVLPCDQFKDARLPSQLLAGGT